MGEPSKELLDLPSEPKPPSLIDARPCPSESLSWSSSSLTSQGTCVVFAESLLVGRREQQQQQQQHKEGKRKAGPPTDPLPKSQVLGRVKDFLGEMAKANEKLQLDVKNKRPEEYDIEALTGNEKEYIEMDLLLGVADLHSEKAVEVAEATMNGFPPSRRPFTCSSSDSEDDNDGRDEDSGDETNMSTKDECKDADEPEAQASKGKKPNKRQKIVVLN